MLKVSKCTLNGHTRSPFKVRIRTLNSHALTWRLFRMRPRQSPKLLRTAFDYAQRRRHVPLQTKSESEDVVVKLLTAKREAHRERIVVSEPTLDQPLLVQKPTEHRALERPIDPQDTHTSTMAPLASKLTVLV